ncbi:MAG: MBL fold metallo-hydrolase [Actinomycetota bacterium]|nr:MBL fold metallo-hydrolase [Actinomycetota bacterium]
MTGVSRVDRVVTAGIFALDEQEWEVENNVWLVGDDEEVLVVDAAHDAEAIRAAIGGRRVVAILLSHGHNDHINAAPALAEATGTPPVYLHADDLMLWHQVFPETNPDRWLTDGLEVSVADTTVAVVHTPGHSPGGCCLWDGAGTLFSGDTLFRGGPGATGRTFSDFPTIIASIKERLLVLPPETVVHTGHGADTTIGEEAPHLDEWIARGY